MVRGSTAGSFAISLKERCRRRPQVANKSLDAIVRSAADAIVTADELGNVVTWNPAAARLFGYDEG